MSGFVVSWPPELFEIAGIAGFVLYVTNYILLTVGCLNSRQVSYFAMNWAAATLVLIGLTNSFNLAAALIQLFWIIVSIIGIVIRLRPARALAQDQSAPATL